MPYGLNKATNYYNKLEALRDWEEIANKALLLGAINSLDEYRPNPSFGWRRIDAITAKLKALVRVVEQRDEAVDAGQKSLSCSPTQHSWKEEYYGYKCQRCQMFIPYGSEPWMPLDE